ncbi:thaumatin-like protein 1b [Salvia miltiorrhiza]|uniref:thaumatin-like protein 1b n=1 Tax=Salvia miltiorrhiza TaxID=226208 RepID=UPI0025ABFFDA|nr:thaumatin-like protein 1b [Salvia miltiorrhiza]XP_057779265.1 thaumatin-like protein 1b [Salvia miltiorrhiza]XP_057779266.1 thaumatin-like protein 1b [Salvia miltiorrhiza]
MSYYFIQIQQQIKFKTSPMEIKILTSLLLAICCFSWADAAVFTVRNNCRFPIWPAALTGTGSPVLTGFELQPRASRDLTIPAPWSGRIWGRFQCSKSGRFTCASGDCNSGRVECNGAGGTPPVTLVEFTLAGDGGKDFYDVSLVDGFNLPVRVSPSGGNCPSTGCPADMNMSCPSELSVRGAGGAVVGCKSACLAFKQPQYCCTGAYSSPATCKPTSYSQIFKSRCPQAYSYAYDDRTSTFTCPTGNNYVVTFCP